MYRAECHLATAINSEEGFNVSVRPKLHMTSRAIHIAEQVNKFNLIVHIYLTGKTAARQITLAFNFISTDTFAICTLLHGQLVRAEEYN